MALDIMTEGTLKRVLKKNTATERIFGGYRWC